MVHEFSTTEKNRRDRKINSSRGNSKSIQLNYAIRIQLSPNAFLQCKICQITFLEISDSA